LPKCEKCDIINTKFVERCRSNMKRILHLSDLHITSEMPIPEKNPFITDLIYKIKQLFPKINVIVFTGDLIDSKKISDKIKHEPEKEKEKLWNKEASLAFELGIKYLKYIKRELGVSDKNIVTCVGNHDVNRNCTVAKRMDCNNKNAITYENRFDVCKEYYDDFTLSKVEFRMLNSVVESTSPITTPGFSLSGPKTHMSMITESTSEPYAS